MSVKPAVARKLARSLDDSAAAPPVERIAFGTPRNALLRRRWALLAVMVIAGLWISGVAHAQPVPTPLVSRIKMVTVAGPDLAKLEAVYTATTDYVVREHGKISAAMAKTWGVPRMAGRRFVLMSSTGSPDIMVRCIEIDPVPGYRGMSSAGWNAFEFIVDDLNKLRKTMEGSPFKIIEEPHFFGGNFATEAAMAVEGPAGEMLYFTTETGDRQKSSFLIPKSQVDRPFVVILGGASLPAIRDFYVKFLNMTPGAVFRMGIVAVQKGLGLPPETLSDLMVVSGSQKNNMIEIDGLPAAIKQRPRAAGQLPPGNAMVSFSVRNLDEVKLTFISSPRKLYGDQRAAAFIGPAGELVELIEDPRP